MTEKEIREEGYTVVFLSDLHYGTVLDKEQLQKAANSIEKEKPDVVILGGDIVDESTTLEEMEEAFSVLGGISSQYGIYFVYGNHDRSNYSASPNYSEQQLADAVKQAGIQTLEDTACEINGEIVLIGRGDKGDGKTGRKSVSQLVEGLDDGKVWILVDHRPADYEAAEKSGCEMILSGHTHGGQIWPIGILSGIAQMDEMNYGYREQGNLTAIVSSGIAGWGLPIRTEGHSEYVVISLSK
ncbi:MAG: metallophosphoesterase [Eubacteriales bacterium]|nr:metallophosphoesterase [Eubacteriales bacterium]